jgi:hypothetical protein
MTKPIKLTKDRQGESFYPATTTDAVVHPGLRKNLTDIIDNINASGVPIVDSVDKLDPEAPQGSLATVAINTGEESTELYIKTNKGWTPYKESDTVYIDAGAVWDYDYVELYGDDYWHYEIPIDEFPKVSQGVPFDELNKYKHVAYDGVVDPLMSYDGSYYSTPQYIFGEDDIWYGQHLEIFADGEYVYVGVDNKYMVKMPCRIYNNVEYLPSDAREGTVASVLETTVEEVTSGGFPSSGLRLKQVEVRDTVLHLSIAAEL